MIDRSVVRPIVGVIGEITGRVDELLEESKLARAWADASADELPEDRVWQLFESAARRHSCPEIGLYAGDRLTVSDLGPFGAQLQNSLTLYHCLNHYITTVSRYSSHARFWLEQDGDKLWFCRQGIDLISHGREQVEQFTIQLMMRIVQLAMGSTWLPSRIQIQAPSDRAFRASSVFDAIDIECRRSATAVQIPGLPGIECITSAVEDSDWVRRIRERIAVGPNAFQLDIDAFAREWNLSRRTLQRKLANQGLEWSRVVERIRFEHAIDRLTVPDLTLIELALGLGYSDQANFGRAFRKWTGISPGSWRRVRRSRQT